MESSLSSSMSRDIVERGTNYRSQLYTACSYFMPTILFFDWKIVKVVMGNKNLDNDLNGLTQILVWPFSDNSSKIESLFPIPILNFPSWKLISYVNGLNTNLLMYLLNLMFLSPVWKKNQNMIICWKTEICLGLSNCQFLHFCFWMSSLNL